MRVSQNGSGRWNPRISSGIARARLYIAAVVAIAALSSAETARSAEAGATIYMLGSRGPMAGFIPPPGVFVQNDTYFYSGSFSGTRDTEIGGLLVANVKAEVWFDFITPTWVTPATILGGNLGFALTLPFGTPKISADAEIIGTPLSRARSDARFSFGDFLPQAFIGWHAGNFHWMIAVMGAVPSGTYVKGQLSNTSLNRPALDVTGAITWLDPQLGLDISAAAGIVFNWQNAATLYETGDEFHLEWAVTKNLTKDLSISAVGYYYQQLTADSGPGAMLGPFKGEVFAVGGALSYNFLIDQLPISTRLKVYREFNATRRLEGTAGFFMISAPLFLYGAPPPPVGPIVAK